MNDKFYGKISELIRNGIEFWVTTVIKSEGHTPASPGMKMVFENNGKITGTIGGGEVEKKVIDFLINHKPCSPQLLEYNLGSESDSAKRTGMLCGGIQSVFIEPGKTKPILYIIGGGHCCKALSEIASLTEFKAVVFDNREDITKLIENNFAEVKIIDYDKLAEHIGFAGDVYIIIMTYSHSYDEYVLEKLAGEKYKYLGMLGSKEKVRIIFENLMHKGITRNTLEKVYSPAGFETGSHTPYEIAVSIMAQIIAVRNGKNPANNNPLLNSDIIA